MLHLLGKVYLKELKKIHYFTEVFLLIKIKMF